MRSYFVLLFLAISTLSWAQPKRNITLTYDLHTMKAHEDSLRKTLDDIRTLPHEADRYAAVEKFIPQLVKTLKEKGSYTYSFDSLKSLSVQYAPDNSFRILTWMMVNDNWTYRYFGAIQKNSEELSLIPLTDASAEMVSPAFREVDNSEWYGALYYDITQITSPSGTPYYLLYGWDANNKLTDKKLVDVLFFDAEGKARFGAPIFEIIRNDGAKEVRYRYIIEFKEGTPVRLNYDNDKKMIIHDYLTKEDNANSEFTSTSDIAYIPDGTYQGLALQPDGLFRVVESVFNHSMASAPVPRPVFGKDSPKKSKTQKTTKNTKKQKKNKKKKPE